MSTDNRQRTTDLGYAIDAELRTLKSFFNNF